MNEIKNLKPFPRFCCSIGYIPTSYKISMTYEEQLLWLCDFLENTVIPTVNQNGQAVEELQNLYIELKHYVDNYFENLDIQTEINNKLDDMAEQGQLTELITDYLNLKCILAFDNISDMSEATNLIAGSFAKTYGRLNLNDGGGAFYYVREILNTDIVDGVNVVALDNPNLVAIRVFDTDNKNILSQIVDTSIYGQIYTADINKGANGLAFANGYVYACGSNGSNSSSGFIVKINLATGERTALQNNLNIGHANDMTYCDKDGYLYIACSGGSNGLPQVSVFNTDLQFVKNVDFTNIGSGTAWGIAYNSSKDVFYILSGNQILEMNYALDNVINTKNMETIDIQTVGQSLYCDNNYIFYIYNIEMNVNSRTSLANRIDVYDANSMQYVTSQKVSIIGEIESGFIYNGYTYFMRLSQNIGVIYKASNYEDNKLLNFVQNNIFLNKDFPVFGQDNAIYINSNYTNFYADGTENKPFNNLWIAQALIYDIPSNNLAFYLTGDFTNFDFVVRSYKQNLKIIGSSDTLTKVGGINISSAENVRIENIEVVKRSGAFNYLLTTQNVKFLDLKNVKLNGAGTEDAGVYAKNTFVYINGLTVSNSFTNNGQAIKLVDGSQLYMTGSYTSSVSNAGVMADTTGAVHLPYRFPMNMASYSEDWNTNIIGGGVTFYLKDIKLCGKYRIEGGNTCQDAPSGYSDNNAKFIVDNVSDIFIYTFIPSNTNKIFKGVRAGTQTSITWNEII